MRIPVLVTPSKRNNSTRWTTEAELYYILQLHDTHIYKCKKGSVMTILHRSLVL